MTGEVATLADLAEALDAWGEAVLVLVAGAEGSTPREAGAAMLVGRTGLSGTIGGGRAEHEAVEVARALLAGPERRREVTVALGPASDQCCGGRLRLAFVRLSAAEIAAAQGDAPGARPGREVPGRLVLWPGGPVFVGRAPGRQVNLHGAGHVGRALALALAPLPFRLRWIDSRLEGFSGAAVPAGCEALTMPIPEAAVAGAERGAFHVVLTHSHAADLEIVDAVLRRGAFGFLGLIGSDSKRTLFRRRLAERGHGEAALARLTCPIGVSGIDDKRPAVIAASVAAQLLEVEQRLAAAEVRVESPV